MGDILDLENYDECWGIMTIPENLIHLCDFLEIVLKLCLCFHPSHLCSQCPTNGPQAGSAVNPVEVTLAGIVTVSNEMCLCFHSQGWDRPARQPTDPP